MRGPATVESHPVVRMRWRTGNEWSARLLCLSLLLGVAIAFDLLRVPIQVSDSLAEIVEAQSSPSPVASFANTLQGTAYLRPLRIAQIKVLFDLAGGHYWLAYRGYHAILLERQALGSGQTVQAQGIIHGGGKYALRGVRDFAAVRATSLMPERWRRSIAGELQPVPSTNDSRVSRQQRIQRGRP